jgi:hypothetical protein
LYVLNYDGYYTTNQPAVERIRYTGSCLLPIIPSSAVPRARDPGLRWMPQGVAVPARHAFILRDLGGRVLVRLRESGPMEYLYRDLRVRYGLQGGLAIAEVRTGSGRFARKIVY